MTREEYGISNKPISTDCYGEINEDVYYFSVKIPLQVQALNLRMKSLGIPYKVEINMLEECQNNEVDFFIDNLKKPLKCVNQKQRAIQHEAFSSNLDSI